MLVGVAWIVLVGLFTASREMGWDSKVRQLVGVDSQLECGKGEGLSSVERFLQAEGDGEAYVLDEQTGALSQGLYSELIGCADLNEDGKDEMVLLADGLRAGGAHAVSWFLLEQKGERWEVALQRTVPTPKVKVNGSVVAESTPGYFEGDPMGAPSFRRRGEVKADGNSWIYTPQEGVGLEREVSLSPETLRADFLGPLEVSSATPEDAIDAFGQPNFESGYRSEVCSYQWLDLGLRIEFANLGGFDACEFGNVQTFSISGSTAESAGWQGPFGVRIGMPLEEVQEVFPSALLSLSDNQSEFVPEDWEAWDLELVPSVIGSTGSLATVIGYFDDDQLRQLDFYVGAAGE